MVLKYKVKDSLCVHNWSQHLQMLYTFACSLTFAARWLDYATKQIRVPTSNNMLIWLPPYMYHRMETIIRFGIRHTRLLWAKTAHTVPTLRCPALPLTRGVYEKGWCGLGSFLASRLPYENVSNRHFRMDLGGLIEGRVAGLFLPACSYVVSSMPWFLSIRLRSLIFHWPSGLVSL